MAREGYIPKNDDEFLAWHDNFKVQLLANAVTLGFVAGDTTPITTDNTDLHTKITANVAAKAAASAAVNNKNMSRVGAEGRARNISKRAKAAPGYTPAIGASLGVIGADSSTDLSTSSPDLTGEHCGTSQILIKFVKGPSDGIALYAKRGAESTFTFLARDTQSPYVDTRALLDVTKPEIREFKAKFVQSDVEVGNFSDILSIACAP